MTRLDINSVPVLVCLVDVRRLGELVQAHRVLEKPERVKCNTVLGAVCNFDNFIDRFFADAVHVPNVAICRIQSRKKHVLVVNRVKVDRIVIELNVGIDCFSGLIPFGECQVRSRLVAFQAIVRDLHKIINTVLDSISLNITDQKLCAALVYAVAVRCADVQILIERFDRYAAVGLQRLIVNVANGSTFLFEHVVPHKQDVAIHKLVVQSAKRWLEAVAQLEIVFHYYVKLVVAIL